MEKPAAPAQRVSFTLSLQSLQDRHVGLLWFWEVLRNLFKVAIHWHLWSEDFRLGGCMCGTLTTFIMILDSLWPFQVLLQSPLHLLGSSDPRCSSPGRRCVCSSHQVRQQIRNITDTRAYKLHVQVIGISLEFCTQNLNSNIFLFSRKLRLQLSPIQP